MERALLAGLRGRGVDAITAIDAGMADSSDEQQLEFASSVGRVLFSFNVSHFYQLHTEYLSRGKPHAGMVLAPQQRYPLRERLRRLLSLIAARTAEEMHDRVEFLGDWPNH